MLPVRPAEIMFCKGSTPSSRLPETDASCGKKPAATALTRMPLGAQSAASFFVIVTCAVFAAALCASPGKPVQIYCALLTTIAPPSPRAMRRRANSAEQRKVQSLAIRVTAPQALRSEEHTSELQSLMRTSYAVFGL